MKKINICYYSADNNFGDALSPLLVEELSGMKTRNRVPYSVSRTLRNIVKCCLRFNFQVLKLIKYPRQKSLVCVGSIISWSNKYCGVWGSGFMNEAEEFKGGKIYAVRGKLTEEKLRKAGWISQGIPCGDPALLLPLWIESSEIKTDEVGIIPHYKEADYFIERYGDRYKIIDLRTKDISKIVHEITSCKYILSSSLHGIIVAHAYQVPALWIKHGYIDTDGFKFYDYFSSVGIEGYDGFSDLDTILGMSGNNWLSLFINNKDKTLINNSLEKIQKDLLQVAPFPLKEKYAEYTKK